MQKENTNEGEGNIPPVVPNQRWLDESDFRCSLITTFCIVIVSHLVIVNSCTYFLDFQLKLQTGNYLNKEAMQRIIWAASDTAASQKHKEVIWTIVIKVTPCLFSYMQNGDVSRTADIDQYLCKARSTQKHPRGLQRMSSSFSSFLR